MSWLSEDPIEAKFVIKYDYTPASKGDYNNPPYEAEISINSVELQHDNKKIDSFGLLKIKLPNGYTYEKWLHDDLVEKAEHHRSEPSYRKEEYEEMKHKESKYLNKVKSCVVQASAPKLTTEQIEEVKKEMIKDGHPVRFLYNGQAVDITTGEMASKGSNIIYHPVYFNFTKETSKKIAQWLNVKPVFDQD